MDHRIERIAIKKLAYTILIDNIQLLKSVVLTALHISEIIQVACIGEFICINDLVIRIIIHKAPNYVRTYKSCSSSMVISIG